MDEDANRSVIGADLHIKGELFSKGTIWLHGRLIGSVEAKSLVVEKDGYIDGTISADEVVIAGKVEGRVDARNVEIRAGGEVNAEIVHNQISVSAGAVLLGQIKRRGKINRTAAKANAEPNTNA